jgi:hypothetical protein
MQFSDDPFEKQKFIAFLSVPSVMMCTLNLKIIPVGLTVFSGFAHRNKAVKTSSQA